MRGKQWEDLGRQTELSMEENGQRAGQDAAAQALQAQVQAGRSRRTYRDFLRRFAVWHEGAAPRPRGIRFRLLQLRPAHLRQSAAD